METNIPRSTWFDRALSAFFYPLQNGIANLTSRKFSDWAKADQWLNQSLDNGNLHISSKDDTTYQAFLKKEIEYWQKPAHGDSQTLHGDEDHPDRNPKLREYWNRFLSGSPALSTVAMFKEMGTFDKALTLGHFAGMEEIMSSGVAKHWTFNSITGRFTDSSEARDTAIISEDLNFASFKEDEYDLIVCSAILHHIVNIDQLLAEINRALKPGGRFVVLDYIGEERFCWKEEKRKYINDLLANIPPKYLRFPYASIDAVHLTRLSPFEAVTSTRLPELLEEHLDPIEVRKGYGVLFPTLQYVRERYLSEDNPILERLIQADHDSIEAGLQPSALSGVYQKRV